MDIFCAEKLGHFLGAFKDKRGCFLMILFSGSGSTMAEQARLFGGWPFFQQRMSWNYQNDCAKISFVFVTINM